MQCHWCEANFTELTLYQCSFRNCRHSQKILCDPCGNCVHRKITDHQFNHTKITAIENNDNNNTFNESHKPQNIFPKSSECDSRQSESLLKAIVSIPASVSVTGAISSIHPLCAVTTAITQVVAVTDEYNNNKIVDENGNKDKEEYVRQCERSVAVPVASMSTSIVVSKLIALTAFSGGIAFIAVIGYGILGAVLSRQMFDRYLPNSTQKRKELKLIALRTFGFFEEDLENENVFNKSVIEKRYKKMAKVYHPDKGGDKCKFQQLEVYHRIVLSILDDDSVFPMVQFDDNGMVHFDQTTQPKAICSDKSPIYQKKGWFDGWW